MLVRDDLNLGESSEAHNDYKKIVSDQAMRQGERALKKAQLEHAKILEQDPNAFSFDVENEDHEGLNEQKFGVHGSEVKKVEEKKKSRYLESLKANAKQREFEYEKALDRMAHKEQLEEDRKNGIDEKEMEKAREVFVTSAYKKRLQERAIWEEEERKKKEKEEREDVVKKENLSTFYSGMINRLSDKGSKVDAKHKITGKENQKENEETSPGINKRDKNRNGINIVEPVQHVTKDSHRELLRNRETRMEDGAVVDNKIATEMRLEESVNQTQTENNEDLETQVEAAKRRALERKKNRGL